MKNKKYIPIVAVITFILGILALGSQLFSKQTTEVKRITDSMLVRSFTCEGNLDNETMSLALKGRANPVEDNESFISTYEFNSGLHVKLIRNKNETSRIIFTALNPPSHLHQYEIKEVLSQLQKGGLRNFKEEEN